MSGISAILLSLLVTSVITADDTSLETTTPNNPTTVINPLCAGYPPNQETLFPNPVNCNHYYRCFEGEFSERICSDGLFFSESNNACVAPEYAECQGGSGSPPDTTVTGITITTIASTTTDSATTTSSSEESTPTTTTSPTTTVTTSPITTTTPPATTTNTNTEESSSPTTTVTTSPISTTTPPATTTTTTTEIITTTTIETTTPNNEDPRCTGNQTSYWPHPSDCHLYIECYQGDSYEMVCPDDKYFSELHKSCVYADESECCTNTPSQCN